MNDSEKRPKTLDFWPKTAENRPKSGSRAAFEAFLAMPRMPWAAAPWARAVAPPWRTAWRWRNACKRWRTSLK